MSGYTDVFVSPVPKSSIEAFRRQAQAFAKIMLEHGALSCATCEADDAPVGKVTSFPQSVALKPDETVFVDIITYRSRAHRDDVMGKVMKDQRMAAMDPKSVPFDGTRMFWGGFKPFSGAQPDSGSVKPYLFLRGRCEEAIDYYKRTLGAEVLMMMRFKDNPDSPGPDEVPVSVGERIMHATLRIAGSDIMMSDGMREGPLDFDCMSLSISVASETEADRLFNALAAGGTVQMPIGPTFFSPRFGAVQDKFGVAWMIIADA